MRKLIVFRFHQLLIPLLVAGAVLNTRAADNVILFIGDGMGPNHVKAGRALVNGSTAAMLHFEQLGVKGQCITILPNGTVTDSATAGTALATGYQHPVNGVISMGANNSIKTTSLEIARNKGLRTGIVTTDDIGGATPGAFGAHEPDRTLMADIRYDYIWDDTTYNHAASLPNVLLGGGYNDPALVPGTTLTYTGLAQAQAYQFVSGCTDLLEATSPNNHLLGLFGSSWAPMTGMAYRSVGTTQPTLSQMLSRSLDLLQNQNGFLLIVESANIDKFSHSNDRNFVFEVPELEKAVQLALDWKNAHPLENTLIIVTADHETGGLAVPDQTIEPGIVPAMSWTTTGHSAVNVPIFATWPAGLDGLTIDNTEVFNLMEDFISYSTGGKPPLIQDLSVSSIADTSASFQWNTTEPSTSELMIDGKLFQDQSRTTSHALTCTELKPGTAYDIIAGSTDMGGFQGVASLRFTTKLGDMNARVAGEPLVTIGVASGSISGVTTLNDGLVQSFTEAVNGAGSRLQVTYTLHTPANMAEIDALTIQGSVAWTQGDGLADGLITEIRVMSPGGYGWQRIGFPFQASPASSYIDESGDILIRFSDTASIRRERKDVLKVDYLMGQITSGNQNPVAPSQPGNLLVTSVSATSISLSWSDAANETGYCVWRYSAAAGWAIAGTLSEGITTFTDNGLSQATAYTYVVRAFNADAFADSGIAEATTFTELFAPSNLTATSRKGVISLAWTDTNSAETGYQILRGTSIDGNFSVLATVGANVTSFSDGTAARGATWYYQVRGLKGTETGPASTIISAISR